MRTLVLATRNRHKAEEIRALLGPEYRCPTLADWPDAPPVIEDGETFAANARKKALCLAGWLGAACPPPGPASAAGEVWVLADDSGLEVDALDGQPGVHSARFAALDSGHPGNATDAENNAKLLRLLAGVPAERRGARFRCVVALAPVSRSRAPAGEVHLFEGVCEGWIGFAPRGEGGFGYDPLFHPQGLDRTFAELSPQEKNRISHRARALARMRAWLESRA